MDIDKIREKLLAATLARVAFDGWTETALLAGAAQAGIDRAMARNAFPGGPAELIETFSREMDLRMLADLETGDLAALKVRDRIAAGVRARLEALAPHREAVRRGLGFFALPPNAALATKCLYRTVDAIWYAAGDTATDYNFYSKRLLLAGVYVSTLLFWLDNRSEGCAETWAFLERRISEVLKFGGRLGRALGGLLDLPERLFGRRAEP
ncbi:MAG: COQ9 family protein [Kiloniellales bacterium]